MTDRSNGSYVKRSSGRAVLATLAFGIVLLASGCGSDSAANDPGQDEGPATTEAEKSSFESPVTAVEPTTTEKPEG